MANMEYVTKAEAAEILRVSLMTINRRIKAGELKSVKFGARVLIPREAIDQINPFRTAKGDKGNAGNDNNQ